MKYSNWIKRNVAISLKDKYVLITGATGGIGKNIAKGYLYLNANLILPCRNSKKGENLKKELLEEFPNSNVILMELDLSSHRSIDNFCNQLNKKIDKLDYLINNAGIYHLPRKKSVDGIELHMATNAIGPVYLTNKLLPLLAKGGSIITVSSLSHKTAHIDLDDFEGEKVKNKTALYGRTKSVLTLNMLKLKGELKNSNISVHLVHPGVCATNLFDANKGGFSKLFNFFIVPIMKFVFFSPAKASLVTLYPLTHPTNINEWITPRGLLEVWGFPKIKKMKRSYDLDCLIKIAELTNKRIIFNPTE